MSFFEVYAVVDGTLDVIGNADDYAEASAAAGKASLELRDCTAVDSFAVYVMEHYCDGDGECECAQWSTDHRPLYSYNRKGTAW